MVLTDTTVVIVYFTKTAITIETTSEKNIKDFVE